MVVIPLFLILVSGGVKYLSNCTQVLCCFIILYSSIILYVVLYSSSFETEYLNSSTQISKAKIIRFANAFRPSKVTVA